VSNLNDELRQLADEAARQARALPVAEVIRQGDRRSTTLWPWSSARPPRAVTQAGPGRRWPGWVAPMAAACGVILAVGLAVGLGSHVHPGRETGPARDSRADTAYVFNGDQGTVTPISPVTGKLGEPVPVVPGTYRAGTGKRRAQVPGIVQDLILPDGTTNYALYLLGRGKGEALRRTSLATGAAGPPIRVGHRAQQMVITPDGRTAYVTYTSISGAPSTIRPVSLATGAVGKPILRVPRAKTPWTTPSMTPDGRTLYVPYLRQGTVTPISTATNTVGKPISAPGASTVMFTPNGRTAFVTGGSTVTPITTATNTPGRRINIGPHTGLWAFTPDGKTVYVIAFGGTFVTPISTRTGRAGRPIPLHTVDGAGSMAITPDGRTLYVTSMKGNRVIPVSLATNTAGKPLNVTGEALNIVITPDGRTAYIFSGMAGEPQVVTPISTATGTPGKPIRTPPGIEVLVPGEQTPH
jgi:DNA-binding beta-propeller fold protein YncE